MSNHWYDKVGNPCYEIEKVDGSGLRPTTLRDAKKHGWLYSVTTVTSIPKKDGLDKWIYGRFLDIIDQNSSLINTNENWKTHVLGIHKQGQDSVMLKGTKIHDALEFIYKNGYSNSDDDYSDFIEPVIVFLNKNFPGQEWISESSFAHKSGYGGKVDLKSRDGSIVLDFKTKDKENLDKIDFYDDYIMQLSAYKQGLVLPDAKCYNLFISTMKKGELRLKEWTEEEEERGLGMFNNLLGYYKLKNKYDPSW